MGIQLGQNTGVLKEPDGGRRNTTACYKHQQESKNTSLKEFHKSHAACFFKVGSTHGVQKAKLAEGCFLTGGKIMLPSSFNDSPRSHHTS